MRCPKCNGEMKRKQRVRPDGKGLEDPRFECYCGWVIDEKTEKGHWKSQSYEA